MGGSLSAPDELWQLVKQIPYGGCTTYGALGRALPHPTTGRMVGQWMRSCPQDVPWWRVVSSKGQMPVWKIDPYLSEQQRQLLESEGVAFSGDGVDLKSCFWEPD